MAKILVADDNSNIQKMVGLALKDQGIDVVAVGNGEAAVRKISDVRPDLVLADVFMPVRNGYEVCQYVKTDTALAHIPVILLVGAFDPLDEQEAQRVGADGVLKKPFVPPDPLISMVKSALARSSGSASGGVAPKEEPAIRAAEMLVPRSAPSISSMAPVTEFPSMESEPAQEPVATQPEPVKIDAGSQPLAFGSLLETPAAEQQEEDLAVTARPQLERDWNSPETEVEEEEEVEEAGSSWRRDGGNESIDGDEPESGAKDWRETAFGDAPARKTHREAWTPQKEISNFQEAAEVQETVSAIVTEAPAEETRVEQVPAAPFSADAWSAALHPSNAAAEQAETVAPAIEAPEPPAPKEVKASEPVMAAPVVEAAKPGQGSSWYSTVLNPWDAEVQKASKLASTWDDSTSAPAASAVHEEQAAFTAPKLAEEDPSATVDILPEPLIEGVKLEETALPAAAVEEIREETHYAAENALEEAHAATGEAKTAEPQMDEVVARVLARMSPEVLQAVTREILKPVVEAMVKDELNAKKK